MKKYIVTSLLICTTLILTCCKTDDVPRDPQEAITLHMYDESNGKTLLGFSDVYINKSQNFRCSSSIINDYGAVSGLGVSLSPNPNLDNFVKEIAVKQGHLYQVYHTNSLIEFPSGKFAAIRDAAYYKVFVPSVITEDDKAVGAEVQFVSEYPDPQGLPEVKYHIGTLYGPNDILEIDLPSDIEWDLERSSGDEHFDIKMEAGKLKIILTSSPDNVYGPYGDYDLYIRLGNVCTTIHFFVEG